MSFFDVAVGVGDLLQRIAPINHRCERTGFRQFCEELYVFPVSGSRSRNDPLGTRERYPGSPEHVRKGPEYQQETSPFREQMFASGVRKGPGGVDDDIVDIADFANIFFRIVDDPVSPEGPDQRDITGAAYARDGCPEMPGKLHGGGSDAPGGPVDEYRLAFLKIAPF